MTIPPKAVDHTVRKSPDDREFWLTCGEKKFAWMLLDDPTLALPDFGVIQAFMQATMKAHMEVAHGA